MYNFVIVFYVEKGKEKNTRKFTPLPGLGGGRNDGVMY